MRQFSTYRMLGYSVVLVLVMLFRPGGIFGHWEFSLIRALKALPTLPQKLSRATAKKPKAAAATAKKKGE